MTASEQIWEQRRGNEDRVGDWMEMQPSGRKFYPLDPRIDEVCVYDIAHHLARINRYNGGIQFERYSVGEHACLMAEWFVKNIPDEPFVAYQALHHDDPEAYIGDMVRPLKRNMPSFVSAEAVIWNRAIGPAFTLGWERDGEVTFDLDDRVKEADNRILVDERQYVVGRSQNQWGIDHLEPLGVRPLGLGATDVARRYLYLHEGLRSTLGL